MNILRAKLSVNAKKISIKEIIFSLLNVIIFFNNNLIFAKSAANNKIINFHAQFVKNKFV